jgi:integrase
VDGSFPAVPKRLIIGQLNELKVRRAKRGWHNDGGGLYLRVEDQERKWWVFRYGAGGKRYHGLGPLHTLSLAEAREQARACRQLLLRGEDPITAGRARRAAMALAAAHTKTFAECAEAYHAAHRAGWSSERHAHEWKKSLEAHALPEIGGLPVASIDTAQVLRVLEPLWTRIPETASRVRGRIEAVLDWAKTRDFREGENPARWRGHLDHLLPAHRKVASRKHHPAMHYRHVPAFMQDLRQRDNPEVGALKFIILTCARECELVGADWTEIKADEDGWTWMVPPGRMKTRKEHRVPLSKAARAVLEKTPSERRDGVIFVGKRGQPLSGHLIWKFLRELVDFATVHGFRSSFRDWAAEQTNFPREVAELALAHRVGDDVERAYRRGDLLRKRRQLAEAWARYCTSVPAAETSKIASIGGGRRG